MLPTKWSARVEKKRQKEQAESAQQQREAASTLLTLRHHADETLAQAEAERMERENAAHAAQEAEVAAMRSQHAGANRFDFTLANPITRNGQAYHATAREMKFLPPEPSQEEADLLTSLQNDPRDFVLFPGPNDDIAGMAGDQGEETELNSDLESEGEESTLQAGSTHSESAPGNEMAPLCQCQESTHSPPRPNEERAVMMRVDREEVELDAADMLRVDSGNQPREPTPFVTTSSTRSAESPYIPGPSQNVQATDGGTSMPQASLSAGMGLIPPAPAPPAPRRRARLALTVHQVEELVLRVIDERRGRSPNCEAEVAADWAWAEMMGEGSYHSRYR